MGSMTGKILVAAAAILTVGLTATACGSATPATHSKPVASAGQDESYTPVPTPSASESPSPMIEKQTITKTQKIPFTKKTVQDSSLAKGTRDVRTKGVAGVKTLTYRVTLTNGVETSRKLPASEDRQKTGHAGDRDRHQGGATSGAGV